MLTGEIRSQSDATWNAFWTGGISNLIILSLFVRSLVGLDRETAMQAFSEFLSGSTSTPNQIEFIQLIVEELTRNGAMEPERLFQSPFTDINAQGPQAVFPGKSSGNCWTSSARSRILQ